MPELPDVTVYVERMQAMLAGHALRALRLCSPFVLRTVEPPAERAVGARVRRVERIGKRIVIGFDNELFLVLHLMVAGRLRWRRQGARVPASSALAVLEFEHGTLLFTEAGRKRRASLHVVEGRAALKAHDRGGLEVMEASADALRAALVRENHTLKRALTDPRILSGIGNAFSDEILHAARLSPFRRTRALDDAELARLFEAIRAVLGHWTRRMREEVGEGFPEKVTAFKKGMAVHGRYRQPCPACAAPVQRIVYASGECNYCARCQTGGRVLADRALSRLLKSNWPRTLEELENG